MTEAKNRMGTHSEFPGDELPTDTDPAALALLVSAETDKLLKDSARAEVGGLLTRAVAARMLGLSERYLSKLIENGTIRCMRYPALDFVGVWGVDVRTLLHVRRRNGKI